MLLVAGPDDLLTFLDTRSRDVRVLEVTQHRQLAFTPDNQHLVTVSVGALVSSSGDLGDSNVRVWDIGTEELVHEYERPNSIYFDLDELCGQLAHASTEGDEVWVRDSASGEQTHHLRLSSPVTGLRFSASGGHLAITTDQARLEILDLSTDQITFRGDIDAPYVTALDASGRYVIVPHSTSAYSRGAALYDVQRGEYVALPAGNRVIETLTISPSADLAAVAYEDGGLNVYALPSARELIAMPTRRVIGMAFLAAGHATTVEVDDTLHVFRLEDGVDVMPPLAHPDGTRTPLVDRAGRLIATGCNDGWVRVWVWQVEDLVAETHARVGRGLTGEELARFLPDEEG
jgi:WD40 repeat protein